jgi:hypothetical protein
MSTEISSDLPGQEPRLRFMRDLASALAQAQAALLALDVDTLEVQNGRQLALCDGLGRIEATSAKHNQDAGIATELSSLLVPSAPPSPPPASSAADALELRRLALQVRNLNQVQAALLRRAARSLEILAALHTRYALTYASPAELRNSPAFLPRNP